MRSALRTGISAFAALAIALAATGWLYVMRPIFSAPGPRVHDALALDELSSHGSVSLALYLLVWGFAVVLMGLTVRWAGAERLTAGIILGSATGGWLYVANGVSILVVRQIPAHEAFRAAASEQAVVIPAVLAGIAGALLGRGRTTQTPRSRIVLAWFVAVVGMLAALDGTFPEHRRSLVTALDAAHVHGLSKALVVPIAIALMVTARSLARGSRRAWQLALVLLTVLLALHIERGFDDGAFVTGLAVVALLARRGDFGLPGDPSSKRRVLLHAVIVVSAVLVYGIVTLWVNRLMADQPYTFGFALRVTGRAVAGLSFHGAHHLTGPVADWFPLSVFLLGVGGAVAVLFEWLAPWRYRLLRRSGEEDVARRLVRTFGSDTLAPFALRNDKSYFFSTDSSAVLAYRVVSGIAIVAGDPIGRADAREHVVRSFLDFAHDRGWRVAVLGAARSELDTYRSLGMRVLYHGDEAVVETASFSLEGRPIRKVRQSVHRLERAGFTALVLRARDVDAPLRAALEDIARTWRGKAPERGFVMALDTFFRPRDDDSVFVIGLDRSGRPHGFLHFAVCGPGSALSLSSMPRTPNLPNGFMEWLICTSISWARDNGFARVSLNFSPFAALLSPEAELSVGQRMQAATLRHMKPWFQLDNLLLFNRKFFPSWQQRFVVYERRRDLPRVGIAALAVEAYLPFQ
jgi:lysyl-tRNA synthetase, class II